MVQGVRILIIMCQLPFRLFEGVGGLGLTTVHGSGSWNFYYHVPIQIIPMVLPFRLLGGRGG